MPRVNNQHHLQLAWNRAKVLADKTDLPVAQCRSYLATLPPERRALLDKTRTKGPLPKAIKEIILGLKHHSITIPRPSEGDPNQQPRAGAPIRTPKGPRRTKGTANYDTLRALKTLADTAGGLQNLQEALDTLRELTK